MARSDPAAELERTNRRLEPSARPTGRPRYDRLIALLLFAAGAATYLGTLTAHHSYDAVAGGVLLYQWIASGSAAQLFHPYHMLYLPLGAALDALATRAGLEIDPLTLLQALNALCAAGALALFYRLARRLGLESALSAALALALGTGSSYWYYATNAEAYAPSLLFLVLAFLSALELPATAPSERILRPGLWLGLAAGFHITSVLALPALAAAAWPGLSCEKPLRRPLLVLLAATAVTLAPYAAVYQRFEGLDPIAGLGGELRASLDPGYRGVSWWSVDPLNVLRQWHGLARAAAPDGTDGLAWLALTLAPLLLLPRLRERPRRSATLGVWFAVTFLFFSAYNTASDKFASYQWIPLLLLIGLGIARLRVLVPAYAGGVAAIVVLAATTAWSSFAVARQRTDPETNAHLARARAIARYTGPEDLVVHLGRGDNQYQKVYTPYFAVRRSLVLDSYFDKTRASGGESLGHVAARIREHLLQQRRVFVLADAAEPTPSRREFERLHELPAGGFDRMFAEFRPQVAAQDPALGRLWSLALPATLPASR